jgi:hypothetical protein
MQRVNEPVGLRVSRVGIGSGLIGWLVGRWGLVYVGFSAGQGERAGWDRGSYYRILNRY